MITPGRLLYLLRRDLARGYRASRHYYRTAPQIVRYRRPNYARAEKEVAVHVLTGKDDWLLALWMLASFHHFTQREWTLFLHDDGTLPEAAATHFHQCFPGTRIIPRPEADAAMRQRLEPFPRCWNYRQSHPLGLKIFDMATFTPGARFIVLDSDLLFFARPDELLDWVEARRHECRFIQDVAEASNVSPEKARELFGFNLWPRVNSGLCLLTRSTIDPAFCEEVFARSPILDGHIWRVEQTLFALCASRAARGGLLPKPYEVTLAPRGSITATARHYVGAVRQHFYGEGLPRLEKLLVPKTPRP